MDAAPESAANLWARELHDEEWVESGVLPAEGQQTVRFDARGVMASEETGIEVLRGQHGAGEGGVTREWAEQMSKFLERESEGVGQHSQGGAEGSGVCPPPPHTPHTPTLSFSPSRHLILRTLTLAQHFFHLMSCPADDLYRCTHLLA